MRARDGARSENVAFDLDGTPIDSRIIAHPRELFALVEGGEIR